MRTGKVRVFTSDEICVAHVLASACLPNFSQAVEIDGEFSGTAATWEIPRCFR